MQIGFQVFNHRSLQDHIQDRGDARIPIHHKALHIRVHKDLHIPVRKALRIQDHILVHSWPKFRGPSFAPYAHRVVGPWRKQRGRRERKEPGIKIIIFE